MKLFLIGAVSVVLHHVTLSHMSLHISHADTQMASGATGGWGQMTYHLLGAWLGM